ncbi:hypothetical protein H5410_014539 [Solanum commersonii]|uniref:Uncharacterized protein n=1 Tax=Solanum commersonii TaxID=4109 RepID=A0A9J5ZRI7_SOLCO|nr:hypothetical protein H5410_014539 [Solanum commersonii]
MWPTPIIMAYLIKAVLLEDSSTWFWSLWSRFKELSINVIHNDKVIELLQIVKDPKIRAQIIDKINKIFTSQNHITEDVPIKEGSYTMAEVKNLLLERRKLISFPTTISDLNVGFKELSINVIDNDKVIELLQIVKDLEIRAQIIDKISNTSTSQNHITEDVLTKEGSYTMMEVKNLLLERRKL